MNKKLNANELNRLDIAAFKDAKKIPIYLVLDNIRSAQNVGSVFRTMDAFRCAGIYLCGITARPPHREINKTALGATDTVQWEYFDSTLDALAVLKSKGIGTYALEQVENAIPLNAFELTAGAEMALVIGNEVDGVAQEVIESVDACLEIPQFGTKHSLNVSVCAGIAIWHIANRINIQDV